MQKWEPYRCTLILVITFSLFFSGLQIIPTSVDSVFLDKFSNGQKSTMITFDSPGIDSDSLKIDVPFEATVLSASMKVTQDVHNGQYPRDVTINVGNDQDNEWEFRGKGYGSFGEQTLFSNGETKKNLYFNNVTFRNDLKIMLPRNATVSSTALTLGGAITTFNELFVTSIGRYSDIYTFLHNGGTTFGSASYVTDIGSSSYGIGLGDFDNDGDLDIVSGMGSSDYIYFHENIGAGPQFASRVFIDSISGGSYITDFAVGDFDNDGNYDFIVGGYNANFYLFKGDGTGGFTKISLSISGFNGQYCLGKDAADINEDGNLDFVSGGYNPNDVYYFEGNGDGTFKAAQAVSVPEVGYWQFALIADDFNNDNHVDILTGDSSSALYFYPGDGTGIFGGGVVSDVDGGSYSGGDSWDFDNDGNVDVIVSNSVSSGDIFFYEGEGDGTFDHINRIRLGGSGGSYCRSVATPPPLVPGVNNAKLDIGDDGDYEWQHPGRFENQEESVSDFTSELNSILSSATKADYTDIYGNEFIIIPLNFTSTADGLIRVKDLRIQYNYTATIEKKGLSSLADEMNQHIVYTGTPSVTIYFIVTSSAAGILKFSNLEVTYNIPPDLSTSIPDLEAFEDTEDLNLLDLSTYFADADEPTANLNYTVIENSESENVEVFTNYTNILKIRPITPNWFGETKVQIQVLDSGNKKMYSNRFTIDVISVNDEPEPKHAIPDVQMIEGDEELEFDLALREYFIDVEEDLLFYSVEVDPKGIRTPEQKQIEVVTYETIVKIESLADFNTYNKTTRKHDPVPIWIYCDDDEDVNKYNEIGENYSYQEIILTILPINDAPFWKPIPDVILYEDETDTFIDFLNIFDYLSDDETMNYDLTVTVDSSNPDIVVTDVVGYLECSVPDNYYGSTTVRMKAIDEMNYESSTSFDLIINPINDPPEISIRSHHNNADVSGTETLSGTALDIENTIKIVEVKIESSDGGPDGINLDWQQAKIFIYVDGEYIDLTSYDTNYGAGANTYLNWSYAWDTTMVPDGSYKVTARVFDGELTDEAIVNLTVNNKLNKEPVVEIVSPEDGAIVTGMVIITGTVYDPENRGITDLEVRVGFDMDWEKIAIGNGSERGWSFTWDSTQVADGERAIYARAYDGQDWSAPVTSLIVVQNGINETTPGPAKAESKEADDSFVWMVVMLVVVVILVIGLLITFQIIIRGKKRIKKYVPDGRMEPEELDKLEASLKSEPSTSTGVAVKHVSVPSAPTTTGTSYGVYTPDAQSTQPGIGVSPGSYNAATPGVTTVTPTTQTSTLIKIKKVN